MTAFAITLLVISTIAFNSVNADEYKVVCYYVDLDHSHAEDKLNFEPGSLVAKLCTHLVFSFGQISDSKLDFRNAHAQSIVPRLTDLKKANPKLKILFGVRKGFFEIKDRCRDDSDKIMGEVAEESVTFLKKHGFDGLDLDVHSGGIEIGSKPDLKFDFTRQCYLLGLVLRKADLLLTAAVPAHPWTVSYGYDIRKFTWAFDWVHLKSYDLHGPWERDAAIHTALYPRDDDQQKQSIGLNVAGAIKTWIDGGCGRHRIVVGMAAYGRSFKLPAGVGDDPKPGTPMAGPGKQGRYTGIPGFLSYFEICAAINDSYVFKRHPEHRSMYAYGAKDGVWVGYDDEESVKEKIDYVKSQELGGAMIWGVNLDDFSGKFCHRGKYPLLWTVKEGLMDKENSSFCDGRRGLFIFEGDCSAYFHCTLERRAVRKLCPAGLVFNPKLSICDTPENTGRMDCE